jgi:hypothetical protein
MVPGRVFITNPGINGCAMSGKLPSRFDFQRPSGIPAPPRDIKYGRVVGAVGIFEEGEKRDYWKVIERVVDDGKVDILYGYYASNGNGWKRKPNHLMLHPAASNELHARAVTEGILEDS